MAILNEQDEKKAVEETTTPFIHPYKVPGVIEANADARKGLRVVNLIGRAPSGLAIPPYGELWGINHSWAYGHTLDKLFIMDGFQAMLGECKCDGIPQDDYIEYLRNAKNTEIIGSFEETLMDKEGKEVRKMNPFPKDVTTSLIPGTFFTSSIAHILAYAAAQEELGFQKIDTLNIYGIEIWCSPDDSEYSEQTECVNFWIPFLYGKGIQVMVPSYLMYAGRTKNNMYGYVRKGPAYNK